MHRETPNDIRRVQRDLAAMQDALGTGYPFDRKTCAAWLAIAAVSALGAVAAWTGSATVAGVTGAGASVIVLAVMTWTVRAGGSRSVAPVAWLEVRRVAAAKLVAGPIVAGFLLWQVRVGTPVSYLVSSTAFFVGVVVMVYATTSPWRRVGFGLAVPLLVFGAAVPILSPSGMLIAAAGTGVVAGLSCASIIAIQMRSLVTSSAP